MGQKKVYANVVDHVLKDGNHKIEDVTKVGLPDISHPTTNVSASGMAGSIDMPDTTRVEAMDFSISHNNGVKCARLARAGKHEFEFRAARQRYSTNNVSMGMEAAKYRVTAIHKQTQKGDIESGNPYGSTETYSVIRYEEELNGVVTVLIDIPGGIVEFDGVRYSDKVANLLN